MVDSKLYVIIFSVMFNCVWSVCVKLHSYLRPLCERDGQQKELMKRDYLSPMKNASKI